MQTRRLWRYKQAVGLSGYASREVPSQGSFPGVATLGLIKYVSLVVLA